jgi:hypothetical protein
MNFVKAVRMIDYPTLYLATLTSPKGRASMQRLINCLHEHNNDLPIDWTTVTRSEVIMMIASMEKQRSFDFYAQYSIISH